MIEPRERIKEIASQWFLKEPALFAVYCTHNVEANFRMSCPIRSGQGRIEYNPDLIAEMSTPELNERMLVEVVRVALRHPYERQPYGCLHQALQMGSDMVIAPAYKIQYHKMTFPRDWNMPEGEHFERYADELNTLLRKTIKEQSPNNGDDSSSDQQNGNSNSDSQSGDNQQEEKQQSSQQQGNGNSDSQNGQQKQNSDNQQDNGNDQSDPTDDSNNGGQSGQDEKEGKGVVIKFPHPVPDDNGYTDLWQEDEEMKEKLKEELQKVTSWGSLAGNMEDLIIKSLTARIDYRRVLSAFHTSIISTNRTLTRMRPNRRFGYDQMGSKHELSSHLLIAVDVSGSVSDEALGKFFRIVEQFFKYGVETLDVIQFDAAVSPEVKTLKQGMAEIKSKKVKVCGRGGTNFQCVFDYLHEHNHYDGLIIMTDGYAPEPTLNFPTRAKILWCTENEQEYNEHKEWMKHTGRACFIMQ